MFSLVGRSCIVTGGGTGIGASLAEGLVRAGGTVVITGRRKHVLDEAVDRIRHNLRTTTNESSDQTIIVENDTATAAGRIFGIPCDITDYDSIPEFVAQATSLAGIPPTILVNNAGINVRQPSADLTVEHWRTSLDLMLTAPFMLTRALSENMKNAKYGRIVSIASLQSYQAFPDSIPYAAAKSGMLGLTRALAEEYSPCHGYEGVTVNAIAPGFVKTDLTEIVFADGVRAQRLADQTLLGRNSLPDDLVGACIFFCSPASSYVTGQTLNVDGGFTALGMR
jgi:NAD(P)-dependent dehydrogenase (short-subunit alcohol dehydrogenase family)